MAAAAEPQTKSTAREYYEALLIAIIFVNFARIFVFQAFKIPSGSMEDNLKIGDHILMSEENEGKMMVAKFDRQKLFLEVANTPAQLEKGLKYRNQIGFSGGMLFDYGANAYGRVGESCPAGQRKRGLTEVPDRVRS